jgi:RNA polymerase sigma factor (sigma-70 family)
VIPADATCWTLIHAAAAGDRAARHAFARLYEPVARAYLAARWRASANLAVLDDAVQDVFVACFKPDGVLDRVVADQPDGFRAFFHGVLKNIARQRESARGIPAAPSAEPAADETSASRAFDRAWAQSLLQEAARLQADAAKDDRAIRRVELLRLRFQAGLPVREIADRWGEDPAKVHHEYAMARAEFRAALSRVMAFHRPTAGPAEIESACRELLELLR